MTRTRTYVEITCPVCRYVFCIDSDTDATLRLSHNNFWCPICKGQMNYSGPSKMERELASLKENLKWAQERADRAMNDAAYYKRQRDAQKGQVTRLKNRAAAGMCPCCNRHFTNLERHMGTKHPEFAKDVSTEHTGTSPAE